MIVDAFPNRPLNGVVGEVTPISIPVRGSDVHIYYANVDIEEGFDDLRPGLSAQILIDVERRPDVTRVAIDAIRWVNGKAYVARYLGASEEQGQLPYRWQQIETGLSDPNFIEVTAGLKPGDRVVAYPSTLPAPEPEKIARR